ncbi:MAG TPA: hypothetical protein VM492_18575 [Sumerlaeia bacterium]|nr:hypothetical protein [Sumerlaeia bacterium]
MKPIGEMAVAELGAYVASHLRGRDIDVVLSGGSCVSIYSRGTYVSMGLDLVNTRFAKRKRIREAMAEIGFQEQGRSFTHPDTGFLVEFPAGPLAVGQEPAQRVDELTLPTGTLRIISATDCVKDRLAGYYHWDDRQCLAQAVLVAQANDVDLGEIEQWSDREGKGDEFRRIEEKLARTYMA